MQTQGMLQTNKISSIAEDLSEPKVILKPEMGGGLAISLVFRYGVQAVAYMGAHCTLLVVQNMKDHAIRYDMCAQTQESSVLAPNRFLCTNHFLLKEFLISYHFCCCSIIRTGELK